MSENEIKPVLWDVTECIGFDGSRAEDITPCPDGRFVHLDDYQSAIDRLLEKIERLEMIERSWLEFMEKTEWVQKSSQPGELGLHRADVLKSRIDRLAAERDAAVADAEEWRFCNGAHQIDDAERIECHVKVGVNVWRGEEWKSFHEGSPAEVRAALKVASSEVK